MGPEPLILREKLGSVPLGLRVGELGSGLLSLREEVGSWTLESERGGWGRMGSHSLAEVIGLVLPQPLPGRAGPWLLSFSTQLCLLLPGALTCLSDTNESWHRIPAA